MICKIIQSPTKGTLDIILRRRGSNKNIDYTNFDSVGLVQGMMIEMIVAADIAEKSAGVFVEELKGSCPQNMIVLAIFGDTQSVKEAIKNIQSSKSGKDEI